MHAETDLELRCPAASSWISDTDPSPLPQPQLLGANISVEHEGEASLILDWRATSRQVLDLVFKASLTQRIDNLQFPEPLSGKTTTVSASQFLQTCSFKYNYAAASRAYLNCAARPGFKPAVAFTMRTGSVKGGGSVQVYRFANWLEELGISVTIYSDDRPPDWIALKAAYRHIPDPELRYSSILEPVVIVYSVLELPQLLKYCPAADRRILHLCQGLEQYHWGDKTASLLSPKPIFDILHSIPVGRLVISEHLQQYFLNSFRQQAYLVPNSIDPAFLAEPPPQKISRDAVTVLTVGNPHSTIKGIQLVWEALNDLAAARPDRQFVLSIVCGHDTANPFLSTKRNLSSRLLSRLSAPQMREEFLKTSVYVNSSLYEGLGLPSLEAMACGVPVIQSDNHGLSGVARNLENCLIVQPGSRAQLHEALSRLIDQPELAPGLAPGGLETARQFSLESQHRAFIAQFEKILGYGFDPRLVSLQKESLAAAQTANPPSVPAATREGPEFFSVLMPVKGEHRRIEAGIRSLLRQTWRNWELILVPDGNLSTEILWAAGRLAGLDGRIRVAIEAGDQPALPGRRLNAAARLARGNWLCVLSMDDELRPEALETYAAQSRSHPTADLLHSDYLTVDERNGMRTATRCGLYEPPALQTLKFFKAEFPEICFPAFKKQVLERYPFSAEPGFCCLFDLFLRASREHASRFIQLPLVERHIRQTPTDDTAQRIALERALCCLEYLNNNTFPALFPGHDLANPYQLLTVAQAALETALNREIPLYKSLGASAFLVTRLAEQLEVPPANAWRAKLITPLTQTAAVLMAGAPPLLLQALERLIGAQPQPRPWQNGDPRALLHQAVLEGRVAPALYASRFGEDVAGAESIKNNTPQIEMRESPKFSIVVPVYNHDHFLPAALDSCRAQTYPHWEAIVMNDGSTDNTPAVMEHYAKLDARIKTFHKTNGGTSSALNEALTHAANPWRCWLSSDDMFEPDKLEAHVEAIAAQPQVLFFHSHYSIFEQKDQLKIAGKVEYYDSLPPPALQLIEFYKWNYVHGNSIAIHQSVFEQAGPFRTRYRNGQDHDMWLRMSALTPFQFINRRTCITRIHGAQGTALAPAYGGLDSARSCLEFTNNHRFEEHFPLLDLENPSHALEAVRRTLQVVSVPSAFMYWGFGYLPYLVDRLLEWLYQEKNSAVLQQLMPQFHALHTEVARSNMPAELKAVFQRLVEPRSAFIYQPYDEFAALEASVRRMEQAGSFKDAKTTREYLERIRTLK